jgi:hypothetical protein
MRHDIQCSQFGFSGRRHYMLDDVEVEGDLMGILEGRVRRGGVRRGRVVVVGDRSACCTRDCVLRAGGFDGRKTVGWHLEDTAVE